MNRRQFLAGSTIALSVGVAGCGFMGESGGGPEAAAEQYIKAMAAGNVDKQEELHYGDDARARTEELELTINEITEISASEYALLEGLDEEGATRLKQRAEEMTDEAGAADYAFVSLNIESEEYGQEEGVFFFLKDDGDWLRHSDNPRDHISSNTTVAPPASFQFDFHTGDDTLKITHQAGESIIASQLFIRGEGLGGNTGQWDGETSGELEGEPAIQAGDSMTLTGVTDDYEANVVWESQDGHATSTLANDSGPQA